MTAGGALGLSNFATWRVIGESVLGARSKSIADYDAIAAAVAPGTFGSPVQPPVAVVDQNGWIILQHKVGGGPTASISGVASNLFLSNAQTVKLPITKVNLSDGRMIETNLTVADRDTTILADNPTPSASNFVDVYRFKVPSGFRFIVGTTVNNNVQLVAVSAS